MAMTREERLARKRARYAANREKRLQEAAAHRAANPGKVAEARRKSYGKHADKRRAESREAYRENHERQLELMRLWREANPDYHRKYSLDRYHADPEAGRAACKAHRQAKPEYHKERMREWAAQNPDKVRNNARKRRARLYGTAVEPIDENEIFAAAGWRCYICDQGVVTDVPFGTPNKAVLEHVVALARGGTHTRDNVQCACHRCNQIKGAHRTPDEVRALLLSDA